MKLLAFFPVVALSLLAAPVAGVPKPIETIQTSTAVVPAEVQVRDTYQVAGPLSDDDNGTTSALTKRVPPGTRPGLRHYLSFVPSALYVSSNLTRLMLSGCND